MATPTPTDTPELEPSLEPPLLEPSLEPPLLDASAGGCTALPSPLASASVSAELVIVNAPPALTVIAPIDARAIDFAMLMPTAAATDTPPSEVSAFGVADALPSPAPPLERESPSPKPRCSFTWPVTPLELPSVGCPPPDASPGAPAAEAFALAVLSEDELAPR